MGHHVSKHSSWGDQDPGDQADGKWGQGGAGTEGPLKRGGVGSWLGPSLPGLPSTSLVLTPHQEFLETHGEPCRFGGQDRAAEGSAWNIHFLIPARCLRWHQWVETPPAGPASPQLSLVPWWLGWARTVLDPPCPQTLLGPGLSALHAPLFLPGTSS